MSSAQAFLEIKGLKKEYVSGNPILKGIDITITEPGIIAIIGPSGTGKSTLLRCINRLIEPTAGQIMFEQADLCDASGGELRKLRRHGIPGVQPGGASERNRKRAHRSAGIHVGLASLAAQLQSAGYQYRV